MSCCQALGEGAGGTASGVRRFPSGRGENLQRVMVTHIVDILNATELHP